MPEGGKGLFVIIIVIVVVIVVIVIVVVVVVIIVVVVVVVVPLPFFFVLIQIVLPFQVPCYLPLSLQGPYSKTLCSFTITAFQRLQLKILVFLRVFLLFWDKIGKISSVLKRETVLKTRLVVSVPLENRRSEKRRRF
ncbi:hypothetical protein E2C01_036376 [Portunus trituberculatus]|uniref:Uncharacterized protein n=1 Tax=Portunus trituberculatus TaxID=210409 RepID=A0A5B7FB70_PORTR|nr:hypothetical protein [Portunus trituberculatus]